ncbi:MAG TPA: glycoside hydrolase family 30 beta sandwich domain-containing protein [Verrucomicrobiae bacterium]|nr:glycoside hydrolase family 30 beta sandwich domain-containing protein [Verrucomicrobiae bacterium]
MNQVSKAARVFQILYRRRVLGVTLLQTAALFFTSPAHAINVTVDYSEKFQTISGLGAMLYPFADRYTDPGFPDLFARDFGASMARMEIVPTVQAEEPANIATYLTDPLDAIIAAMDFKGTDNNKAGKVIKPIYEARLDDLKLIATVWSPPKWMKTNHDTRNGGSLRPDRREHFAKYLAAYCQGFEKTYGVPIFALSIQNELMFKESYNSCLYNPDTTEWADAMAAVAKAFRRYGIKTKLFGPENMGLPGWFLENNRKFAAQVITNHDTMAFVQAWAFHGYQSDGKTVASSKNNWAAYFQAFKSTGKELWMTETSGNSPSWIHTNKEGTPDGALAMGVALHDALVAGNINAWTYWSFQDGDSVNEYNLTARGDKNSKKYNAAKHFFRYIRPGAVRVRATPDTDNLNVSAFLHDQQQTLTLVFVNIATDSVDVNLHIPATPGVKSFKVFVTTPDASFVAQSAAKVSDGITSLSVPAQSIVTLYGQAAASPARR